MNNIFKKPQPEKIEDIMAKIFPEHTTEEWKKLFPVIKENGYDKVDKRAL